MIKRLMIPLLSMLSIFAMDQGQDYISMLPNELHEYILVLLLDKNAVRKSIQSIRGVKATHKYFYNLVKCRFNIPRLAKLLEVTPRTIALHCINLHKLSPQQAQVLQAAYPAYKKFDQELIDAADTNHHDRVWELLKLNADVNTQDYLFRTALIVAATRGHKDIAIILLNAGAEVGVRGEHGWTALHCASMNGHAEVVSLLIDAGAEVNVQDLVGYTALMHAAFRGSKNIVVLLLKAHADVNIQNTLGHTALMAIGSVRYIKRYEEIISLLLKAGAAINMHDKDGNTALIYAIRRGYKGIAKILLHAGADVTLQNNNGETAFAIALKCGYADIVQLINNISKNKNTTKRRSC